MTRHIHPRPSIRVNTFMPSMRTPGQLMRWKTPLHFLYVCAYWTSSLDIICLFCGSREHSIFSSSFLVNSTPISQTTSLKTIIVIISYLKPKSTHVDGTIANPEHIANELKFDKYLAQCSLAVDGIADALVTVAPTSSQITYISLSCLSSFTSGGNPALHSLGAVCLHAAGFSSEVGSLFGGMAVLSAIAHVISVRAQMSLITQAEFNITISLPSLP
jgi:hypothetical protein